MLLPSLNTWLWGASGVVRRTDVGFRRRSALLRCLLGVAEGLGPDVEDSLGAKAFPRAVRLLESRFQSGAFVLISDF